MEGNNAVGSAGADISMAVVFGFGEFLFVPFKITSLAYFFLKTGIDSFDNGEVDRDNGVTSVSCNIVLGNRAILCIFVSVPFEGIPQDDGGVYGGIVCFFDRQGERYDGVTSMHGGECLFVHVFLIVFLPVPFVIVSFANSGGDGCCSRFGLFEVQCDDGVAVCCGFKGLLVVARRCISGGVPSECAVLADIIRPLRLYPAFASDTQVQGDDTVAVLDILSHDGV